MTNVFVAAWPAEEDSLAARFESMAKACSSRAALVSDGWQPTYGQLNSSANRIAHALLARRYAPEGRVAILMRYDSPLIAAIVAVVKTPLIAVVLRPADPVDQLRQIVDHTEPDSILTDVHHRQLADELAGSRRVVIGFEDCAAQGPAHNPNMRIAADATAMLAYSSGTTGPPKTVMMTHREFAEDSTRLSRGAEILREDRIAQFAAICTGSGVKSSFLALLNGATLFPFAVDEKGLGGVGKWLLEREITVTLWPSSIFRSFIRTLGDGLQFPRMRIVRVGGETTTSEDFAAFCKHFSPGSTFVHHFASTEAGNIAQLCLAHGTVVGKGRLPLGQPCAGVEISIEDEHGNEVHRGEVGEIVIRSNKLAWGYWRDPPLTEKRFSQDGAAGKFRVFRGGDLGRLNGDGLLEHAGRKDTQVKIRGFRVIPADVEDAVRSLPAVKDAAVCAHEDPDGGARIVAYVVLNAGAVKSTAALRRALLSKLPDHMIPPAFVTLDALPLTASGKVDREKLIRIKPSLAGGIKPPLGRTETALAAIWCEELDLAGVDRDDDFFSLGGDSLQVAAVLGQIHETFGVRLDFGVFTNHSTLAELAAIIDRPRANAADDEPPLVRCSRENGVPLSFIQERAWRFSQSSTAAAYNSIVAYRILGPLDRDILRDCMTYLAARHEPLRTTFRVVQGRPVQIIHPPAPVQLPFLDLAASAEPERHAMLEFENEVARPFDLAEGPLLRFLLIRIAENEHCLLRSCQHLIHDATSSAIHFRELGLLYDAKMRGADPPLPEFEQLQYADYAAWERKAIDRDSAAYKASVQWWRNNLAGAPPVLSLPFRRPQPLSAVDPKEGRIRWAMEPETSRQLAKLAREEGTTYFVVGLAAFVLLLSASSGETDMVLGTYVANRDRPELQNMYGWFSNLVTLRFRCEFDGTFRDWLRIVHKRTMETLAQSRIPYEVLREELLRQGAVPPDIQVIFNADQDRASFDVAGLKFTRLWRHVGGMPWGLSINLNEPDENDQCGAWFDAGMHRSSELHQLIGRYRRLLNAVAHDPNLSVDDLVGLRADKLRAELPKSVVREMPHPEKRAQDELQELRDRVLKLEARVESLGSGFSRARQMARRPWLRPPLWTFEQYAPKKLRIASAYRGEKVQTDAIAMAIVTPNYNHGKFLAATIDSVLTQHYPRLSYAVQDGGSLDDSLDVLRSYGGRLAWHSERDGGQAQAINRAFATTAGEVMAYLNSDDMLLPGTLAHVARVFAARPDIDIVYGHRIFVDRDGLEIGRAVLPRHDAEALYWADYIPQETMFWRRRVWERVGQFDESFDYALDWDFILRAQHAGFSFLRVPRFLAAFRVHDEQKTSKNYDRGREEMQRLRSRYIGYAPSHREIMRRMMPYLLRQLAVHWMYRLRIVRY